MKKLIYCSAALALLLTACANQGDKDAESSSAAEPVPPSVEETEPSVEESEERQADYALAYRDLVRERDAAEEGLSYALIDLDGDETPELVAAQNGMWIDLYTWRDGEVRQIAEQWPYGAMGNAGYEYLPGQNVIRNQNSDLAGAVVYTSLLRLNEAGEFEDYYDEPLTTWAFEDRNGNGMPEEDELLDEDSYLYYYGETQLSEVEFSEYLMLGDYEWIAGEQSADEICAELETK